MGTGMGKGEQEGRLAEAHATTRFQSIAEEVGGRKNLLLAFSEQEAEQGLRASPTELGGFHLCSDEPHYGKEARPCLRIIRQFL